MEHNSPTPTIQKKEEHGSLQSYLVGFSLCLILTLSSFFLVEEALLTGWHLILTISAIAVVQVFVQLYFFLQLGQEPSPRWKLMVFFYMVSIVVIVVIGTLWIMYNLDTNMMMGEMPFSTKPTNSANLGN